MGLPNLDCFTLGLTNSTKYSLVKDWIRNNSGLNSPGQSRPTPKVTRDMETDANPQDGSLPLPWKSDDGRTITAANGDFIADLRDCVVGSGEGDSSKAREEVCDRIVRAVNNHEAMLYALDRLLEAHRLYESECEKGVECFVRDAVDTLIEAQIAADDVIARVRKGG
jgi:hypothetical protein